MMTAIGYTGLVEEPSDADSHCVKSLWCSVETKWQHGVCKKTILPFDCLQDSGLGVEENEAVGKFKVHFGLKGPPPYASNNI